MSESASAQATKLDFLRHTLATLADRGGKAIRGENYLKARIAAGTVGAEQPAAVREFD